MPVCFVGHDSPMNAITENEFTERWKAIAKLVPTPDHYAPLLYILGAADENDPIRVFNEKRTMGSLSMRSYLIG